MDPAAPPDNPRSGKQESRAHLKTCVKVSTAITALRALHSTLCGPPCGVSTPIWASGSPWLGPDLAPTSAGLKRQCLVPLVVMCPLEPTQSGDRRGTPME